MGILVSECLETQISIHISMPLCVRPFTGEDFTGSGWCRRVAPVQRLRVFCRLKAY